jgi:hypothetical protein
MKTLFPAIRVSDLDASLSFYPSACYDAAEQPFRVWTA